METVRETGKGKRTTETDRKRKRETERREHESKKGQKLETKSVTRKGWREE